VNYTYALRIRYRAGIMTMAMRIVTEFMNVAVPTCPSISDVKPGTIRRDRGEEDEDHDDLDIAGERQEEPHQRRDRDQNR